MAVQGAQEASALLTEVGASSEGAGLKLKSLVMGGLAVAGAALVAVGVASTKMAGDWQQNMTKLVTSGGESRDALKMVSDGLLSMAVQVGTSTDQMAKGMYYVESAGFHGAAGLQVLKAAAMGAKAENADLGVVANAVTSALNAYGYGADKAAFVTNTLVAATANGKMTMQDLASAVSNVLPATSKFHISLIDTTAAIATMTMQGDDASSAATHLRQVILALEAPAKGGAAALQEIGLSTAQVSAEMKVSLPDTIQTIADALGKKFPEGSAAYNQAIKLIAGGSKQLLGMLELSGTSLQKFKDNVANMTAQVKAGGDSIAGWDLIQGNFNFKLDQAKTAIEVLMIKVGTGLLPVVGNIIGAITPAIQGFSDWITKGNALTGIIDEIGRAFHSVFDTIAYPIDKATQVIVTLNDAFDKASGVIHTVNNALTPLKDAFDHASGVIQSTTVAAKPLLDAFDRASGVIGSTTKAATPMLDAFDRATGVMHATTNGAHGVAQSVSPLVLIFQDIFNAVKEAISVLQTISGVFNTIKGNSQFLVPVVAGLAAIIMTALVPAVWSLAAGVIAATWPVLAIGVAVAGVAAILVYAYQHWAGFRSVVNAAAAALQVAWAYITANFIPAMQLLGSLFQAYVLPALSQVGNFLLTTFTPVWKQLGDLWKQVVPLGRQLGEALAPLLPVLEAIGMVIGAVVLTSLGILFATLKGLVQALATFIGGVITWIGGFVRFFTGMVQVFSGVLSFIVDLTTGHFEKLGADLNRIWQGIGNIFAGGWQMIKGLFQMTIGTILSYVSGFVSGIIDYFKALYDTLVGHSIVPDMVNSIVQWFLDLGPRALSAVGNMISDVTNAFLGFANNAYSWGSQLINNFVSGLQSNVSGATGIMHNLHIPGFAAGTDNAPGGNALVAENGMELITGPRVGYLPPGSHVIPHAQTMSMLGGGGGTQHIHIEVGGHEVLSYLIDHMGNAMMQQSILQYGGRRF